MELYYGKDGIQDMPRDDKGQSSYEPTPRTPGAHAVGGRPTCLYSHNLSTPLNVDVEFAAMDLSRRDHDEEETVAFDASLVTEEEATIVTLAEPSETSNTALACFEVFEGKALPIPKHQQVDSSATAIKKWVLLLLTFLAVGTAVILILVFTIGEEEMSSEDMAFAPRFPPGTIDFPPFLPDELPTNILLEIQKQDTPEYHANRWMWEDPNLYHYSTQRRLQRFAMVVFFYSTHGDEWYHNDNWLDYDISECQWYSSYNENNDDPICDQDSNLLIFDFHQNNLQGNLPGLTNFYPSMRWFNVADNHLTGSPPPLSSSLKDIEAYIVSNNQMAGQLVTYAGFEANKIRIVKLDRNQFSGYVNPVFHVLPQLEILNLTSNAFANDVPHQLQHTPKLQYLGMGHNQWYGTLPTELAALTDLKEMHWQGNANIIGSIPTEFGALISLQQLDIGQTQITGRVPEVLCQLAPILHVVANCSQVECCL